MWEGIKEVVSVDWLFIFLSKRNEKIKEIKKMNEVFSDELVCA